MIRNQMKTFKHFFTESPDSIQALYDYVKDKPVHDIPMKKILHELEPKSWEEGEERPGTPEFIDRAERSELKYPIITFKDDEQVKPGELSIMDGVHRIWKAYHIKKQDSIKGHILTREEAKGFKWKDDAGVEVTFL